MNAKKSQAKLLIVDDNEYYSDALKVYFEKMRYLVDIAPSAKEAHMLLQKKGWVYYDIILTDITMESQLAGLFMLRKIFKNDFQGTIIVASTGFDFPGMITLSRLVLGIIGVNYIVPKKSITRGKPIFYPIGFAKQPSSIFEDLIISKN